MKVGSRNSNVREITVKDITGNRVATIRITKPAKKKTKRLKYNFKEISNQVLMSKTSGIAGGVAVRARAKIAILQRQLKSGDYDSREVEHAIAHAKKIERIARKRMKHLKEEEKAKRQGSCVVETEEDNVFDKYNLDSDESLELSKEELKELMREFRQLMEELMEEMREATESEELAEELTGSALEEVTPEELDRLKKKHRSDELREIMEADMKYLKALFSKLEKERQEAGGGVSLELSGVEVPVETMEAPVVTEGGNLDITV